MKTREVKKGMLVIVVDDSYSMIGKNNPTKMGELGGYLQNRNPWEVVRYKPGQPTNDHNSIKSQSNNVVIKKGNEIAYTQARFLIPYIEKPEVPN